MTQDPDARDLPTAPALALLAQLPGQVAVVGADGTVLAVNTGWRAFAAGNGLSPGLAEGGNYLKVCDAAGGEEAAYAQLAAAGIRGVLAGRQHEFNLDYPCHAPQQRRWFRMQVVPVGWAGAQAALVMHTDITGLRQARDEVLRLNASLERRVQRRTRQLELANKELEAFSYSVSHDLKAPLAAIDGFTHVLAERLRDRMDERESGYLQRVRAGVAAMFGLIDAMLSLHQLARSAPLRRTNVDISAMAHALVEELRAAEPDRICRIIIEPGMVMTCDASLMAVVLRNLIGNAWKFSSRKEVMQLEVGLEWGAPAGFTTLRVSDRGAGFDPKLASKLFAPFQRLHHASDFPGTGIGLATVQRIVQRHGGSVRAEAELGEGASFFVSLPEVYQDTVDSNRED
ncbi:ATP-binding protein [Ramlibacter sp. XY19]|uniref:sensor histidine kinase n=1 Tax=Ramlibacter paludis TaxID=2908000 RepID=UPI0023DBE489|nr:ATP-binding protein [Ramlibacter paludis]MCG2594802.1 ATP-binding protein [Ramlibacter paludis]